jgi:hypothetical protein
MHTLFTIQRHRRPSTAVSRAAAGRQARRKIPAITVCMRAVPKVSRPVTSRSTSSRSTGIDGRGPAAGTVAASPTDDAVRPEDGPERPEELLPDPAATSHHVELEGREVRQTALPAVQAQSAFSVIHAQQASLTRPGHSGKHVARNVTETNGIHLVLFGQQNRTFGPYVAAINRILISLVKGHTLLARRRFRRTEPL